jgi:hypothetical protein
MPSARNSRPIQWAELTQWVAMGSSPKAAPALPHPELRPRARKPEEADVSSCKENSHRERWFRARRQFQALR